MRRSATSVRVARNSLRVGRTLLQRWWGEAVLAKVRLHVPVDYFRIANDSPAIRKFAYSLSRTLKAGRKYRISAGVSIRNILDHANPGLIVSNIASPLFGQANQMYG